VLQTLVVLGIALTPGWLGPTWLTVPWTIGVLVLVGPMLVFTWVHAPWVPTPHAELPRILAALDLAPGQSFCDLGCGDGRVLLAVRRATGAICTGIEAAPALVILARLRALVRGSGGVRVRLGDLYQADLSSFDVVYVWGTPYSVGTPRFRALIERSMRPGARLVSFQTPIPGLVPTAIDTQGPRPIHVYVR
jgi:SAM-dependent methyltransferase